MITKEEILEQLAKAQRTKDDLQAKYFQAAGIIRDCEHWLRVLEEKENNQQTNNGKTSKSKTPIADKKLTV